MGGVDLAAQLIQAGGVQVFPRGMLVGAQDQQVPHEVLRLELRVARQGTDLLAGREVPVRAGGATKIKGRLMRKVFRKPASKIRKKRHCPGFCRHWNCHTWGLGETGWALHFEGGVSHPTALQKNIHNNSEGGKHSGGRNS